MKWTVVSKQTLFDGFFRLSELHIRHQLFAGGESSLLRRELLEKGDAVGLLPYDPERDELVLVEQFRIGALDDPAGPWLIEIIAGYQEPDEKPETVAVREALEEADCHISQLQFIHRYYSTPGGSSEKIHLFFGLTDSSALGGVHGLKNEGEDIRVRVVSSQTAFEWLDQGKIDSAMPTIALQWFRLHREGIRRQWRDTSSGKPD
ncbi:MAG: NUDIX domain-containing protein [Pseudomonadota bacterium]